jgi:hypothetical protein
MCEHDIPGYNKVWKQRQYKGGGGLMIYVKEIYDIEMCDLTFSPSTCEYLYVKIKQGLELVISILLMYRPPSCSKIDFLDQLSANIGFCSDKDFMIIGDMNINLLEETAVVLEYETLMMSNGLQKMINKATREEYVNDELIRSCIDHSFIRCVRAETSSCVVNKKITDNFIIVAAFRSILHIPLTKVNQDNFKQIKCPEAFRKQLLKLIPELKQIECNAEVDVYYDQLCTHMENARKNSELLVRKKLYKRPFKPWITSYIVDKANHRDKLFQKWKNCKSVTDKEKYRFHYKEARNKVNSIIVKAKKEYYNKLFL